jgi:hypothetical protein
MRFKALHHESLKEQRMQVSSATCCSWEARCYPHCAPAVRVELPLEQATCPVLSVPAPASHVLPRPHCPLW